MAIAPEQFADAAFFSIGSNDLTQYVMAAARDNGQVAALNEVTIPPCSSSSARWQRLAASNAVPVSLCGDAGGDPSAIPALLRRGCAIFPLLLRSWRWPRRRSQACRCRFRDGICRRTKPCRARIEAIRAYKSILAAVIEQRPSGTRQRLADALGKHRSFITQITSPAYPTPIPAKHLAVDLFRLPLGPGGARRIPGAYRCGPSRQSGAGRRAAQDCGICR